MSEPQRDTALNLLEEIVENLPAGAELSFVSFDFAPLIEKRGLLDPTEMEAVVNGLHLRETLRLPFWEGVLLAASTGECSGGHGLLEAAAFHQTIGSRRIWIPIREVDAGRLSAMCLEAQQEKRILAVTSAVRLRDGAIMHLPMMDFHLAYSNSATALVTRLIDHWGMSGALLRSGKSYHFYGRNLLTESSLAQFLGRALLYTPIVDRAWIAHQLIEQSCALRISARAEYGGSPNILARLG